MIPGTKSQKAFLNFIFTLKRKSDLIRLRKFMVVFHNFILCLNYRDKFSIHQTDCLGTANDHAFCAEMVGVLPQIRVYRGKELISTHVEPETVSDFLERAIIESQPDLPPAGLG